MRKLIGALAIMTLLASSFTFYARWTRRNPPAFSVGGSFQGAESPSPGATPSASTRATGTGKKGTRNGMRAATPTPSATTSGTAGSGGVAVSDPAEGTYTYTATGHESIDVGPSCGWDVTEVTSIVSKDANAFVFDWTYAPQRQERIVYDYAAKGIYTTFAGAAVTCFGVRTTSEGHYTPPALRLALPLKVGTTWRSDTATEDRSESIRGKILRRETIRVPAGRFDTFVMRLSADLSGGQTGTFRETLWFSPALGVGIRAISDTDVRASAGHFVSHIDRRLASVPDA